MASLPVIVSFGGISPAGRSSFHHGYRRMLAEALDAETVKQTYTDLAILMNLLKYKDGSYTDVEVRLKPYLHYRVTLFLQAK